MAKKALGEAAAAVVRDDRTATCSGGGVAPSGGGLRFLAVEPLLRG